MNITTRAKPVLITTARETGFSLLLLLGQESGSSSDLDFLDESATESSRNWLGLYFDWVWNVLQGDLGTSIRTGIPVTQQIASVGINTLVLTLGAILLTLVIAVPIAVWSSLRTHGFITQTLNIAGYIVSALPVFWLGYIIIYISSKHFNYFPIYMGFGTGSLDTTQIMLPILVLGLGSGIIAETIRFMRFELGHVLAEEYIRTARAKGSSIWKHAYKEGLLLPITEIVATRIPFVISGAIIVEQIFNWPGLGRMAWQAAQDRDFPVIMGITLVATLLVRLGTLCQRFIYIYVNPRASHE